MSARRFALVSPNFYPRTCGVGDYSMRVAQELQRRGFDCEIFTRTPATPNPAAPDVRVTGVSGPMPLVIAERIRRRLEAYSPTDVVLQYTPQMFGASRGGTAAPVWLAAAARRLQANVIVVAHELYLSWNIRPDILVGAALMRCQAAAVMTAAHRILTTVETRAAKLRQLGRFLGVSDRVGVVRVGPGALPVARQPRPGRLRLGTFSTLGRDKRFDVLLDCFARVHARRPEAELIILGDLGDPNAKHVRAFHDAVARHPARARIEIRGKQRLDDIAREMAELDVYLFSMFTGANTRSSTLPVALGTGLPVVAIRGVETDGLFVDGENVLFAAEMSGPAFADAVFRIADDPAFSDRLSAGASTLYRSQLAWERVVDQLLSQIEAPQRTSLGASAPPTL